MLGAQPIEDLVEVQHVLHPDLLLISWRGFGPARFRPISVVIPLEEGDVVVGGQSVEKLEHVFLDVGVREVEQHLVASLGAGPPWEVHRPVRMRAIQVAIGVDHFRFHPEPELHAEAIDLLNQTAQAVRKFVLVHSPIAEACMIAVAGAKPAVVHDETFDTNLGSLFGERLLPRFINFELGCFPGVIQNRTPFRAQATRENVDSLEAMKESGGLTKAAICVASIERRRVEGLARIQLVGEIEWIQPASDADLLMRRLLNRYLPTAAPTECSKPDLAVILVGLAIAIDREPRVHLVARATAAAFENLLAAADHRSLDLCLTGPATGERAETVAFAGRQIEGCGLGALDHSRSCRLISDVSLASE